MLKEIGQATAYKILNPFVRLLVQMKVTPNAITTIGLILNIFGAVVFIFGAEFGDRGDLRYVGWGGGIILFAGVFDMLDGQVARIGNMTSKFGALYDSVLDRYSELIMFLGICYYLVAHHYFVGALISFLAMIGSIMVSYTRARAEGLGIQCAVGLMQRPERVVTIGLSAIICGIASSYFGGNYKFFVSFLPFHLFETVTIFTFPVLVVAVLANYTAIDRLNHCRIELRKMEKHHTAASPHEKIKI
jgi:CDP-diacylglycerol--glycerol-3-phosphate 3-phosphatidyltransferase